MATQVQLEARLETLRTAMATGAKTITVDGQTITYNSYSDMKKAEADIVLQLEYVIAGEDLPARPMSRTINLRGF